MTKARDLANIISGGFDATDIPNLDTAKITSGTFVDARLPATALNSNVDLTNLSASNLTSGTVADARLPSTALNSNVDLTTLSASNLTSGTVATARLGTGTADATTFLRGDNTFASAGGTNTPSFFAVSTSSEDSNNVSDNTLTKMTFSTEVYDTDSNYASNRFTPTTAGKYFIFAKAMSDNVIANAQSKLEFYKNGSQMDENYRMRFKTGGTVGDIEHTMILSAIIDMNGSGDYIEVYAQHNNGGNTGGLFDKHFGAYKLIGV